MKKNRWIIGWVVFVLICMFIGCCCGCSWQQVTKTSYTADGRPMKTVYINTGTILREFVIEDSTLELSASIYRLKMGEHESKSSKVKVSTPYGIGEVE